MKLVTLYECLFEAKVDSEVMRPFMSLCADEKVKNRARFILRKFNLTEREVELFGISSDPLKEKKANNKTTPRHYKAALVYLFAKKHFPQYNNSKLVRILGDYFSPNSDEKVLLALIDRHFNAKYESFIKEIMKISFISILKKYPIDLPTWQSLLLENINHEDVLFFWIAPLLQHCINEVPKTLVDIKQTYALLHSKEWSYEPLLAFFIVSLFLAKEDCFFEKLSDTNFKTMTQTGLQVDKIVSLLTGKINLQTQLIKRLDNSFLKDSKLECGQLIDLMGKLDKSVAASFINKNASTSESFFNIIMSQSFESNLSNLIRITNIYLQKPEDKLTFFLRIPNQSLEPYFNDSFYLSNLLECLPIESRYEFFIKKVTKNSATKLLDNPHLFCKIVSLLDSENQIPWLKTYFSPESLLKIKSQGNSESWKRLFSSKLSQDAKVELNKYMYPGKALSTHYILKRIKIMLINVFNLRSKNNANINMQNEYKSPIIDCKLDSLPKPIQDQISIFKSIKTGKMNNTLGLVEIIKIGNTESKNLSNSALLRKQYTFFQSSSEKNYINAFANDESFNNRFIHPTNH